MICRPIEFAHRLLEWFDVHGRHDLPWQHPRTPYRVWVSEVMLQQTQVGTVIDYFERFIAAFPDLTTLANASEDDVLAHWSGLGYYARGRNLHRAAQQLHDRGLNTLPNTLDELMALPGIGRSTAGAILSMGFNRRAPILDGNVKRVLCRYAGIEGWPGARQIEKRLWVLSESLTPHERVCDYTQAIMDLGATLCVRRRPDCENCPLQQDCNAHKHGLTDALPAPRPRRTQPERTAVALILVDEQGRCHMERRPSSGIWGGLWCPPLAGWDVPLKQARAQLAQRFGLQPSQLKQATGFRHSFTHFHLRVLPLTLQIGVECYPATDTGTQALKPIDPTHTDAGIPAPFRKWLTDYLAGVQQ